MKCFYHNDLDGYASGAVVKKKYPECKLYEIDYSVQFPFDEILKDETVIIVDFSLKSNEFEELLKITDNIIWCDHHQTAILELSKFTVEGIRVDTFPSAAIITWKYFFPNEPIPKILKYVNDWDTHSLLFNETKLFYYGSQAFDISPNNKIWKKLLNNNEEVIDTIINAGSYIKTATENNNKNFVRNYAYETEFEGFNCIACNKGFVGSDLFLSIKKEYDLYLIYVHNGEKFRISIYRGSNNDILCNEIAKKYGGGGHPGAAGFTCESIPWIKKVNYESN